MTSRGNQLRTPVFLLTALSLIHPAALFANESAPMPTYSIKADAPRMGSNIKRELITGSRIPFDKRYAELSVDERRLVKSQYEGMGEADEPPFPANGLRRMHKALAAAQQELAVDGPLTAFVDIDSQGKATSVSVVESPSPEMSKAATSVLMREKYKPASAVAWRVRCSSR